MWLSKYEVAPVAERDEREIHWMKLGWKCSYRTFITDHMGEKVSYLWIWNLSVPAPEQNSEEERQWKPVQ